MLTIKERNELLNKLEDIKEKACIVIKYLTKKDEIEKVALGLFNAMVDFAAAIKNTEDLINRY